MRSDDETFYHSCLSFCCSVCLLFQRIYLLIFWVHSSVNYVLSVLNPWAVFCNSSQGTNLVIFILRVSVQNINQVIFIFSVSWLFFTLTASTLSRKVKLKIITILYSLLNLSFKFNFIQTVKALLLGLLPPCLVLPLLYTVAFRCVLCYAIHSTVGHQISQRPNKIQI